MTKLKFNNFVMSVVFRTLPPNNKKIFFKKTLNSVIITKMKNIREDYS